MCTQVTYVLTPSFSALLSHERLVCTAAADAATATTDDATTDGAAAADDTAAAGDAATADGTATNDSAGSRNAASAEHDGVFVPRGSDPYLTIDLGCTRDAERPARPKCGGDEPAACHGIYDDGV